MKKAMALGALVCLLAAGCRKPKTEIPPCDCAQIRQAAVQACGGEANLTAFSCDPATCTYGYSCNNLSGGLGGQTETAGGD